MRHETIEQKPTPGSGRGCFFSPSDAAVDLVAHRF
jgi:hypothetical protein